LDKGLQKLVGTFLDIVMDAPDEVPQLAHVCLLSCSILFNLWAANVMGTMSCKVGD